MTDFLQFALSGFWTFLGVLILVTILGRYVIALILGAASIARGIPVRFSSPSQSNEDILRVVRAALDDGKLDASVSRIISRNRMRGRP